MTGTLGGGAVPVLYDPAMAMAPPDGDRRSGPGSRRSRASARCSTRGSRDHAYPPHTHDSGRVFIVDDGAIRYDLDRRERAAEPAMVTVLPPHVVHDGRPATSRRLPQARPLPRDGRARGDLIGPAVDRPAILDGSLRARRRTPA